MRIAARDISGSCVILRIQQYGPELNIKRSALLGLTMAYGRLSTTIALWNCSLSLYINMKSALSAKQKLLHKYHNTFHMLRLRFSSRGQ